MCDYSIILAKTRPAKVDDKLVVTDFGGFASPGDPKTAVCLLPGTELVFDDCVYISSYFHGGWLSNKPRVLASRTARFRQIHKDNPHTHHDALEFGDGQFVLLTHLALGQRATVLQLPAAPKTEAEAKDQERLPVVA